MQVFQGFYMDNDLEKAGINKIRGLWNANETKERKRSRKAKRKYCRTGKCYYVCIEEK